MTSPSGMTEICDIQDLGTSQYSIKFVPKEMGIHTVSVKHRGMHIPGLFLATFFLQHAATMLCTVLATAALFIRPSHNGIVSKWMNVG